MAILNCSYCGGTHYGSNNCPFIPAPCIICGTETVMACSDCAIDSGGKNSVHVCNDTDCRDKHEIRQHTPSGPDAPKEGGER